MIEKYVPSVTEVSIPTSNQICDWISFFELLLEMDYAAPFYVMMAHFAFLYDLDVDVPSTLYTSLYEDIAVAICLDDEAPIEAAAIGSGFLAKGVAMLVSAAELQDKYHKDYITCIKAILKQEEYLRRFLPNGVWEKAITIILGPGSTSEDIIHLDVLPDPTDKTRWVKYFETAMLEDLNAPASIISYYLENLTGIDSRVFCPLGYELYRKIGIAMREHDAILDAAIESGLMASAIPAYFYPALDVIENWTTELEGIKFLLNSKKLRQFIPFDDRFIAMKLLDAITVVNEDRDGPKWRSKLCELRDTLHSRAMLGY